MDKNENFNKTQMNFKTIPKNFQNNNINKSNLFKNNLLPNQ
jgi:hypothetical protein